MGKIELPIKEIVEKYENGISMQDISKEYYVSVSTIANRLKEYYEKSEIKKVDKRELKKKKLLTEEIVKKFEYGITITKMSRFYGVSSYDIKDILQKYYEQKGMGIPKILRHTGIIKEFLKRGMTIKEISDIALKKDIIISRDIIKMYSKGEYLNDSER